MKIKSYIKTAGMSLLLVNFLVACASAPEEAPQEQKEPEKAAPAETKPMAAATTNYQVMKGDNLWNISGKSSIYGNPYQWPLIYKANTDKIKDADLIYPGQDLTINTNPSSSDVSAAVQHAKTRGSWSVGAVEASDKAYLGQ